MDAYSSGEELLVKTRKPYTITKQRERWTDEEHNRFLEALKLYGRAWQRIEEHIGTKTAVQIRSHAQKFFSKLEKEAHVKGVPVGQAIDIEIPPPRPKRKPSNPYPRKTGAVCSPNAQVRAKDVKHTSSCPSHSSQQTADLDKEPRSEETPSPLGPPSKEIPASVAEATIQLSNLEFVPVNKPSVNHTTSESHVDDGPNIYHKPDKPDSVEIVQNDSSRSFRRHASVQILDGCQEACSQGLSSDVSYQEPRVQMEIVGHPGLYSKPAVSGAVESQNSTSRSSNHQIYPGFHPPFDPLPSNQEGYSSFLQMTSTFSSLVVSALLQNPAAHAAASYAASLWPSTNVGNSESSIPGNSDGVAPRPMHPTPSMAAIAGATVAAATAWWAAHGLLPFTPAFHSGFSVPPASIPTTVGNVGQSSVASEEKEANKSQIPDSQVQQPEHSASNSGNSGEIMDIEVVATDPNGVSSINEQKEGSKGKNKKQVDRSSCGSNTPSGSDAETDALGKNVKENEESNEADLNNYNSELNVRRLKLIGNIPENWKEVSEEGRLAFRALFSKGRLPQSFSPPSNNCDKEQKITDGVEDQGQYATQSNNEASPSLLDLNSNAWECISSNQDNDETGSIGQSNDGFSQGKLTSNRTGFKPYKRCSVEARESRMLNSTNPEQGNCSKRLRLEGDASL
ncbi:protein LATE ELONGATED HYPOCOTYL-like isoform X2 [Silene latifolia]|uniref:protein LATE ELONGATED HYPOCOTYL-like isoform X2 n=1 Tax=Silene latifolia TaxID=37657 RepID=UPI003D771C21